MINTYNESSLHRALKLLYAQKTGGLTEQKSGPFIADVLSPSGVTEIQTKNVSALKSKIEYFISQKIPVNVVHPIVREKTIITLSSSGELLSKRKSPNEETLYSLPKELTGIYNLLTKELFTLTILDTSVIEIRRKTEQKSQLVNKSRRFLKDWLPEDKKLKEILSQKILKTKEDYKNLLPKGINENFTIPDIQKGIIDYKMAELNKKSLSQKLKKGSYKEARLLIWLLEKMQILYKSGSKGKSRLYSINQ